MTAIAVLVCVVCLAVAIGMWRIDRVERHTQSVSWDATAEDAPPLAAQRPPAPAATAISLEEIGADEMFEDMPDSDAESELSPAAALPAPSAAPSAAPAAPGGPPPAPRPASMPEPSAPAEAPRRSMQHKGVLAATSVDSRPPRQSAPVAKHLGLAGELDAPSRIYANDTCGVSVKLTNRGIHIGKRVGLKAAPQSGDRGGEDLKINIEAKDLGSTELEIELLCAGAVVAGDAKQRQRLLQSSLEFHWSCFFPHAGDHAMTFVVRTAGPGGGTTLGVVHHKVKVAKVTGMNKDGARLTARLAAAASVVAGAVSFASELGVLDQVIAKIM